MSRIDQVLGHKANLNKRLAIVLQEGIKGQIDEGPVIAGLTGLVFQVGIGGPPLVKAMAVAGTEQVVRPDVVRLFLKGHKLGQQFLPFRRIGVVDLIIANIIPVVRQLSQPLAGIDTNVGFF